MRKYIYLIIFQEKRKLSLLSIFSSYIYIMPKNNRKIGAKNEDLATKYLQSQGYTILDRNWHWSNRGEIDIVALDPKRFGREYVVFVEVKYRASSKLMSLMALNYSKIQQIKKLAQIYLERKNIDRSQFISFDFIAIHQNDIQHIKNIMV
jgi:putative endonuclease